MYEKNLDGYYKNRHSCFLLSYHLVLVTKYRKPVLTGVVLQTVKDVILSVMKERGCIVKRRKAHRAVGFFNTLKNH